MVIVLNGILPINKKSRILILSVKQSGRVRIHKSRENPDGSIQIGRTWDFEELVRIELDEDVPTGFILEIGKNYYWETNSPKERRVWLTTVLEQYIKYFNGKRVPKLDNCSLQYFHLQVDPQAVQEAQPRRSIPSSSHSTSYDGSRTSFSSAPKTPTLPSTASSQSSPRLRQGSLPLGKQRISGPTIPDSLTSPRKGNFKLPDDNYNPDMAHKRNTSNKSIEKFMAMQTTAALAEKEKGAKQEAEKREKEQAILERQRALERLEAEKKEKIKREREKREQEIHERERVERERLERQKHEREARERERAEAERSRAELIARKEKEELERLRLQQVEAERQRQAQIERENAEAAERERELEQRRLAQQSLGGGGSSGVVPELLSAKSNTNSSGRQHSLASSVGSIKFVGHRRR
ncbi:unnamed protein product [Ambrosiozyma monospora]|uniref:Unnamed protein product n=1 Tax=Ambrosiozyma monospora TaxID=43982 RepID=A0ACB5TBU5_AMBMO|nr:unnamed protein product [Ambrosiozyma monospora]